MFRKVALCLLEALKQALLNRVALFTGELLHQLDDTPGIGNHLNGLDAREFVKEPAAARVHEHGVSFHLEKLECRDTFFA